MGRVNECVTSKYLKALDLGNILGRSLHFCQALEKRLSDWSMSKIIMGFLTARDIASRCEVQEAWKEWTLISGGRGVFTLRQRSQTDYFFSFTRVK